MQLVLIFAHLLELFCCFVVNVQLIFCRFWPLSGFPRWFGMVGISLILDIPLNVAPRDVDVTMILHFGNTYMLYPLDLSLEFLQHLQLGLLASIYSIHAQFPVYSGTFRLLRVIRIM